MMTTNLYLDDCLPILSRMKDGAVGAVVTDPPDRITVDHLEYFAACMRVSGGRVAWIGAARTLTFISRYEPRPENIIAWVPPQFQSNPAIFRYHPIACWGLSNGADVSTIRDEIVPYSWDHSGTKPVSVMKKLIQLFDGDGIILDPFLGSGSTGVACLELGRAFIGIDTSRKSYEIAEKRLRGET